MSDDTGPPKRKQSTLEHAKFTLASVRQKLEQAGPDAMRKGMSRVHVAWQGGEQFDTGRPGGAVARIDGTGETGQSPVDMLLSALAACTSADVVSILAKRRTPVRRLEVGVAGRRAETTPRRFLQIRLDFVIDGTDIERDHAERAIELSMTKYCSVHDTLATDLRIEWSLILNGEKGLLRVDPTRSAIVSP